MMGVQKNFNQTQVAIVEQGNEEREKGKRGDQFHMKPHAPSQVKGPKKCQSKVLQLELELLGSLTFRFGPFRFLDLNLTKATNF